MIKLADFIDIIDGYKISRGRRDFIVSNLNGTYENHGHFHKLSTCYVIIRIMKKKAIPRSVYLLEAAKRITDDPKYREILTMKQNKTKQMYFNSNRGIRR